MTSLKTLLSNTTYKPNGELEITSDFDENDKYASKFMNGNNTLDPILFLGRFFLVTMFAVGPGMRYICTLSPTGDRLFGDKPETTY